MSIGEAMAVEAIPCKTLDIISVLREISALQEYYLSIKYGGLIK